MQQADYLSGEGIVSSTSMGNARGNEGVLGEDFHPFHARVDSSYLFNPISP